MSETRVEAVAKAMFESTCAGSWEKEVKLLDGPKRYLSAALEFRRLADVAVITLEAVDEDRHDQYTAHGKEQF